MRSEADVCPVSASGQVLPETEVVPTTSAFSSSGHSLGASALAGRPERGRRRKAGHTRAQAGRDESERLVAISLSWWSQFHVALTRCEFEDDCSASDRTFDASRIT